MRKWRGDRNCMFERFNFKILPLSPPPLSVLLCLLSTSLFTASLANHSHSSVSLSLSLSLSVCVCVFVCVCVCVFLSQSKASWDIYTGSPELLYGRIMFDSINHMKRSYHCYYCCFYYHYNCCFYYHYYYCYYNCYHMPANTTTATAVAATSNLCYCYCYCQYCD